MNSHFFDDYVISGARRCADFIGRRSACLLVGWRVVPSPAPSNPGVIRRRDCHPVPAALLSCSVQLIGHQACELCGLRSGSSSQAAASSACGLPSSRPRTVVLLPVSCSSFADVSIPALRPRPSSKEIRETFIWILGRPNPINPK